jgi:hypothetical protein
MNREDFIKRLRDATENEVETALQGSKITLPITTGYEALEFFNCMIDVLTEVRGDEESADRDRIRPGFGSTHTK